MPSLLSKYRKKRDSQRPGDVADTSASSAEKPSSRHQAPSEKSLVDDSSPKSTVTNKSDAPPGPHPVGERGPHLNSPFLGAQSQGGSLTYGPNSASQGGVPSTGGASGVQEPDPNGQAMANRSGVPGNSQGPGRILKTSGHPHGPHEPANQTGGPKGGRVGSPHNTPGQQRPGDGVRGQPGPSQPGAYPTRTTGGALNNTSKTGPSGNPAAPGPSDYVPGPSAGPSAGPSVGQTALSSGPHPPSRGQRQSTLSSGPQPQSHGQPPVHGQLLAAGAPQGDRSRDTQRRTRPTVEGGTLYDDQQYPDLPPSEHPWAEWAIRRAAPSPRFGHSANSVAARDGELFILGGIRDSDILDDLWVIDTLKLVGYQLKTEGPKVSPRVGHAALTLGNAYIMFGGDTKFKETDPLDNNLYLLNTSTAKWTVADPKGRRPPGRYGHSIANIGVKVYVFGGQEERQFYDDMWMFDLTTLRSPNSQWHQVKPSTPGPSPRTNHTVVTYQDKIYLFGGANGDLWYSDTWVFDPADNSWTQLDCTGYVPAPCQGHAATIIGDVMYVFGGMSSKGQLIDQLFALKLSTRKWYTFQNLGPGPSSRSGHSLTAFDNDKIVVWGGSDTNNAAYVLDVSRINYPSDDSDSTNTIKRIENSTFDEPSFTGVGQEQGRGNRSADNLTGEESAFNPLKTSNVPHIAPPSLPAAGPAAETTSAQPRDTTERSTPAARNSVIYSNRVSWSPQKVDQFSGSSASERDSLNDNYASAMDIAAISRSPDAVQAPGTQYPGETRLDSPSTIHYNGSGIVSGQDKDATPIRGTDGPDASGHFGFTPDSSEVDKSHHMRSPYDAMNASAGLAGRAGDSTRSASDWSDHSGVSQRSVSGGGKPSILGDPFEARSNTKSSREPLQAQTQAGDFNRADNSANGVSEFNGPDGSLMGGSKFQNPLGHDDVNAHNNERGVVGAAGAAVAGAVGAVAAGASSLLSRTSTKKHGEGDASATPQVAAESTPDSSPANKGLSSRIGQGQNDQLTDPMPGAWVESPKFDSPKQAADAAPDKGVGRVERHKRDERDDRAFGSTPRDAIKSPVSGVGVTSPREYNAAELSGHGDSSREARNTAGSHPLQGSANDRDVPFSPGPAVSSVQKSPSQKMDWWPSDQNQARGANIAVSDVSAPITQAAQTAKAEPQPRDGQSAKPTLAEEAPPRDSHNAKPTLSEVLSRDIQRVESPQTRQFTSYENGDVSHERPTTATQKKGDAYTEMGYSPHRAGDTVSSPTGSTKFRGLYEVTSPGSPSLEPHEVSTLRARLAEFEKRDLDSEYYELKQSFLRLKHELVTEREVRASLEHDHTTLQAQHKDVTAEHAHLKGTMDDHMQGLAAARKTLGASQARITELEKKSLSLEEENKSLRQRLDESERSHAKLVSTIKDLESQSLQHKEESSNLRDISTKQNNALDQHLNRLLEHWSAFSSSRSHNKDRSLGDENSGSPRDVQHYKSLYETHKTASGQAHSELDKAHAEILNLRARLRDEMVRAAAGPTKSDIDLISQRHDASQRELKERYNETHLKFRDLEERHRNAQAMWTEKHSKLQSSLEAEIKELKSKNVDLENECTTSMEYFRNQRIALERTHDELTRQKEANARLENLLSEARLQGDPDVSNASVGSFNSRRAELMVRDLRAQIIILEEERDELRANLVKAKKAAITAKAGGEY